MWNRGGPPQLTAHLRRLMPVINPIVFASRPTILRNAKNLCCMGKRHSGRSRARVCAREDLKEAAELADLLTDQDATGAIKVLRAGLKATKKFWDANTREWVEQPDRKYSMNQPWQFWPTLTANRSNAKWWRPANSRISRRSSVAFLRVPWR